MEYFDLFDKNGIKLNKKMARGSRTERDEYHKVVHIWIRNSAGEYLVQQRNKASDFNPYQWAPTAGAVSAGEEPLIAAIRETEEEIGLKLEPSELNYIDFLFVKNDNANYIVEIYLVNKEITLEELTLDPIEVKTIGFMTTDKIFEMIDTKEFWDFKQYLPEYNYFGVLEKSLK
jgi:8-oxo-dGTP pyrophosphatase MutT (NUDIX family)